ncbi:hypothetical protein COI75_20690 [Bacillus cereus]|nr:hypothetical protein COI75_20690 [Bacillus cereus]
MFLLLSSLLPAPFKFLLRKIIKIETSIKRRKLPSIMDSSISVESDFNSYYVVIILYYIICFYEMVCFCFKYKLKTCVFTVPLVYMSIVHKKIGKEDNK